MERRRFGRTGLETSVLGFGGFHLIEIPSKEAEYLLNEYLDAGGNYIETAASYGNRESELKIGKVIATRRSECVLVTKTEERGKQGCVESVELSLQNLNADTIDVLLMHAVATMSELEAILGPGGAMEGVHLLQQQGKVRFVGISMHGQPDVLIAALQRYPFDAVMTTINYYDRFNFPEIEEVLIPLAQQKDAAIILMKPVVDGLLWRSAAKALQYAMGQPVSVVVAGINTREILQMDLQCANQFSPMTPEEQEELWHTAPELGNYVCRQCNLCLPCPEGINMPEIFRYEGYFDRQMRDGKVRDAAEFALRDRLRFWFDNRNMAKEKYAAIAPKATRCTKCGLCIEKCPYGIDIVQKLAIADYKLAGKKEY